MNTQKRLTILTTDEIHQLYSRPLFTAKERVQYFSLSQMGVTISKKENCTFRHNLDTN